MTLDVQQLSSLMIDAARDAVAGRWPSLQAMAEVELRRIAQSLDDVAELLASGAIDESHARKLVHIHQITTRSILSTVDGLGILTAEEAVRAATHAVATIVNTALKFKII